MILSALIRKRDSGRFATAIPAIAATQTHKQLVTIAKIANVAVAKLAKAQPGADGGADCSPMPVLNLGCDGLFHVIDGESPAVICSLSATDVEMLASSSAAILNTPQNQRQFHPEFVDADSEDRRDDRRRCSQCRNLRGRTCTIAKPGGLVSANRGYQPAADTLQRCTGYSPPLTGNDQRNGRERWPIL